MQKIKLGEIAKIDISNVDKKSKDNETPVTLCNFVDVYYNWAITSSMIPFLMKATANINQIERFSIHKGQVAITKDSETRDDIGVATYIADEIPNGVLGYHCALITPDESVLNGKYLNVLLHSPYAQKYFAANASGSGQRYTLTTEIISGLPVILPDMETQQKIGKIFSDIDRKIENNNTINTELEAMAKTIYDYWFLQFEFPDENGKPYKSSGGKMVWCEELNREIPEGWKVGNLYDIADFINGLACQKFRPISPANKLPVVKIGEMHSGITDQTEYVRDDIPEKHIINDGDILFSWSATLETILWTGGKAGLNQHIFKVNPKGFAKYYVFMQLSAYIINFIRMAEARKTTMGHITTDHLKQSRIALPPKYIAQQYSNTVATMFQMVIKNNEQNRELASLRDFLLPLLMNGQVTFGDR